MGVPLDPPNRQAPPTVRAQPYWSTRATVRTLLTVVAVTVTLYLIYLLRKPIGWVLIATFLAVALSGPVNLLNDYMRRGFAITIVYLCLLLIPIGIGALIVPPLVEQGNNLIQNLPSYAEDAQEFATKNQQLRERFEVDWLVDCVGHELDEVTHTLDNPGRIARGGVHDGAPVQSVLVE